MRERDLAEITRKRASLILEKCRNGFWQQTQLLPKKTVYENVAFAFRISLKQTKKIAEDVPAALGLVNMNKKADRYPKRVVWGVFEGSTSEGDGKQPVYTHSGRAYRKFRPRYSVGHYVSFGRSKSLRHYGSGGNTH